MSTFQATKEKQSDLLAIAGCKKLAEPPTMCESGLKMCEASLNMCDVGRPQVGLRLASQSVILVCSSEKS